MAFYAESAFEHQPTNEPYKKIVIVSISTEIIVREM